MHCISIGKLSIFRQEIEIPGLRDLWRQLVSGNLDSGFPTNVDLKAFWETQRISEYQSFAKVPQGKHSSGQRTQIGHFH